MPSTLTSSTPVDRQIWLPYFAALALVTLAATLRVWPLQALGSTLTWLTFYPAVMLAAVYGGLFAGLLATLMACATVTFLWPLLVSQAFINNTADWLGMSVFVLTGAMISAVAEGMHRANIRAEESRNQSEIANQHLSRSVEKMAQNERFIKSITDAMPGLVAYWDKDLRCRFANNPYLEWFGKTPEAMLGITINELLGNSLFALNKHFIDGVLAGESQQFERNLTKTDGSIGYTWVSYIPDVDAQGAVIGFFVLVSDITALKEVKAELELAATVYKNTLEGIMITDAKGVILSVNPAFSEITGYAAEEAIGQTPRLLKSDRHDEPFYAAMWERLRLFGTWQGEIFDRRKNGEIYPKWLTITGVKDSDSVISHYIGSQIDISERKAAESRIINLAFYDPLTNLPNRRLLLDRLDQALVSSKRSQKNNALFFIDLDHFKKLNDSLGHDQGDHLLQQVAQRLETAVREGDTVARLGGDEFVVMLEDLSEQVSEAASQAKVVGEKMLALLNQPYQLNQQEYFGTPSIGVVLFGNHQKTREEVLKQADLAMYQAKSAGRNTLLFFDPEMQAAVTARVALENDLRNALREGQLVLHYQAQVDAHQRCNGAEALVRWQHPQRGMVFPDDFIPLAEESGLILALGQQVLEIACAQLATWATQPKTKRLYLAVNVSGQQMRQPDFVEQVMDVLERTGADPQKLKLELTESHLLTEVEDTIAKMTALSNQGIGFALDDFGTGYSSLSYLKRLPIEKLKIDRSFVMDVLTDPNDAAIAKTIVALADTLGLSVIAEGVETEGQQKFLAENGCFKYQGYLYSRPLPLAAFEEYLATRD
jgi:diguanylate cyclase (GGDEF)-like protein/PAS domain S-box-containing protein